MVDIGNNLKKVSEILLDGGVVSFPTETVMGMGAVYDDYDAYVYLNILKGERGNKPYTMMLYSTEDIEEYAVVSEAARKVINAFLPGPLTILLKAKESVPSYVTHGTGVVGIRVPQHPICHEILKLVSKPLLVPSANPSNLPPATTVNEVSVYFGETLDYIVSNDSDKEQPSTIVDLTSKNINILREGKIKKEEILKVLGE